MYRGIKANKQVLGNSIHETYMTGHKKDWRNKI